jgi:hypothetical protein
MPSSWTHFERWQVEGAWNSPKQKLILELPRRAIHQWLGSQSEYAHLSQVEDDILVLAFNYMHSAASRKAGEKMAAALVKGWRDCMCKVLQTWPATKQEMAKEQAQKAAASEQRKQKRLETKKRKAAAASSAASAGSGDADTSAADDSDAASVHFQSTPKRQKRRSVVSASGSGSTPRSRPASVLNSPAPIAAAAASSPTRGSQRAPGSSRRGAASVVSPAAAPAAAIHDTDLPNTPSPPAPLLAAMSDERMQQQLQTDAVAPAVVDPEDDGDWEDDDESWAPAAQDR